MAARTDLSELWIIGYGNPQRRDDGIGPYVVERLAEAWGNRKDIRFRAMHQLDPALAEELQHAGRMIFVDATLAKLEEGWQCAEVCTQPGTMPRTTHWMDPSFLLRILDSVYHRSPRAWLVSIQGEDFGFGEGLSPEAGTRAEKAILEIVKRITAKQG